MKSPKRLSNQKQAFKQVKKAGNLHIRSTSISDKKAF
jgi:hypothetical protein